MNHAYSAPPNQKAAAAMLVEIARTWRGARDLGDPVQPSLFAALSPYECGMLAPVFDSLMTLCEAALGRPLATGEAADLSDDEHLLLGLLDGTKPRRACIDCPASAASALDCAICSTRIMIAMTLPNPPCGASRRLSRAP